MTTTGPFELNYLDELALRRDLTACFLIVIDGRESDDLRPWLPALAAALDRTPGGRPESFSPADQDRVVDAWAEQLRSRKLFAEPGSVRAAAEGVPLVELVRRARQVRVRNDGLTPQGWIDRTFAGRRAPLARAVVRSLGTAAGPGTCRCLDQPIIAGWQCCGSPWLDNGDLERFITRARHNVNLLAAVVRDGAVAAIVDPVCQSIITVDYLAYVGGPAAELVAEAYARTGLRVPPT